jgi:photosystem II stability/assembly factor-like uncharacterized protein
MKKLILILVMLFAINASGQWVKMNGPTTNNIRDIIYYNGNYFAATHGMGIVKSTNNGSDWIMTLGYTFNESLLEFNNILFAGIQQQGVWYTTNNGNNWIPTNLNSGFYAYPLGKFANKIFTGLAQTQTIYSSTNLGQNWIFAYENSTNCYETRGNMFYIGNYNGIYTSSDTGKSFLYRAFLNRSILSLKIKDDTTFYAGVKSTSVMQGGLFRASDAGITWYPTSLFNVNVNSIDINGNYTFAGTDSGVFVSSNNGLSWRNKSDGLPALHSVNKILVSNGYIFAGIFDGGIYRRGVSEIIGIQNISTEIPASYSLSQNYPNPFNPSTKIKFSIVSSPHGVGGDLVLLKVYDIMGREVQTLVNEDLKAGTYEVTFDGSTQNSGVYFYKLTTDGFTETKRMILLK